MVKMNVLYISLIATIVFGLIDACFFLFAEETLQQQILKIPHFDQVMAELTTGAISAATALFVANLVRLQLKRHYQLLDHPLLDVIGLFLGASLVLTFYVMIRYYRKNDKDNSKDTS